jgi:hypothetical protein
MLKASVHDKHIIDVTPIPIDINSHFQAMLAPAANHPLNPLLAEQKPALLSVR